MIGLGEDVGCRFSSPIKGISLNAEPNHPQNLVNSLHRSLRGSLHFAFLLIDAIIVCSSLNFPYYIIFDDYGTKLNYNFGVLLYVIFDPKKVLKI